MEKHCKSLWAALAVVATLAIGVGPASANEVVNGGFETPDASAGDVPGAGAPWINFGAPTVFTTAAVAHSGTQSLKMFGPFDSVGGGVGAVQKAPALPGQTWVSEAWARSNSNDAITDGNFLALKIEFLDAAMALLPGGAGVSVFETQFTSADPLDGWVKLGVGTAPAPAGTAFAQVVLVHVQGPPAITGGSVFVDDVTLVPEPASLSLLAVGGLALLRRRRVA